MSTEKKKIAIVVQRYGKGVNGGAEVNSRLIAEHLSLAYDVTILTTCAKNYNTWKPEFEGGVYKEETLTIRRFYNYPRGTRGQLRRIRHRVTHRLWYNYILNFFGLQNWAEGLLKFIKISETDYYKWLKLQGPYCPSMVDFIKEKKDDYDVFIFFSMLYYTTSAAIKEVKSKSILVPTLHNEKASFYPMYPSVINAAEWLFYGTSTEKKLAETIFNISHKKNEVVGIGVEVPFFAKTDVASIVLPNEYLLYLGRIDANKGCDDLIDYFLRFKKETNCPSLKLVMAGQSDKILKNTTDIIYPGFVDELTKHQLIKDCKILLIPSKYESLSMVLLEAFHYKKPVIVNGLCDVLKDHILVSNGGFYYENYQQFAKSLVLLLSNLPLANVLGTNGFNYVNTFYSWKVVLNKFKNAIDDIVNKQLDKINS